jgi:hypothetical protein
LEQYNREELYRKVWEQPLLKVAEEYGVSAVALGKTCRKLSVPVPGRGHWAKLAHGHASVKRPALPKLDKVPIIYRSPLAQKRPTSSDQNDPEFATINQLVCSGALNPPTIDPTARPHPLIRGTASRLRSHSRKDENGILLPREPGGLDVKVSEGMLDRALEVMAKVVSVLERQGFSVEVSEQGCTLALINGEHLSFGIEELIRRVVTQKPRFPIQPIAGITTKSLHMSPRESWRSSFTREHGSDTNNERNGVTPNSNGSRTSFPTLFPD